MGMLTVPRPIRKYRKSRSRMKLQRRSRRARARPAKRNTLPLFTPATMSTPPPCPSTKRIAFNYSKTLKTKTHCPPKKSTKRQKRRIRTFYSKKWGNRLYGLSTGCFPQNPVQPIVASNDGMNAWHLQLSQRTAFEHDEDLESLRSPSPTVSAVMDHLNVTDYALNYDSSVSNIAANTDHEGYHDEEEETDIDHTNRLKIIVSAPEHHLDEREMDRMNIKRLRRRYIPSDTEMNSAQYCSDLGPSDIGSSDTDYLSDSIPPPLDH